MGHGVAEEVLVGHVKSVLVLWWQLLPVWIIWFQLLDNFDPLVVVCGSFSHWVRI